MSELHKLMKHYFEINQYYPGNDYWNKLIEKAIKADQASEVGVQPEVSLPKPEVIFIMFRKFFTTDNPEYIESYTDYDLAQMEMIKASQDDPQRNYYLQCVIPKARSN